MAVGIVRSVRGVILEQMYNGEEGENHPCGSLASPVAWSRAAQRGSLTGARMRLFVGSVARTRRSIPVAVYDIDRVERLSRIRAAKCWCSCVVPQRGRGQIYVGENISADSARYGAVFDNGVR